MPTLRERLAHPFLRGGLKSGSLEDRKAFLQSESGKIFVEAVLAHSQYGYSAKQQREFIDALLGLEGTVIMTVLEPNESGGFYLENVAYAKGGELGVDRLVLVDEPRKALRIETESGLVGYLLLECANWVGGMFAGTSAEITVEEPAPTPSPAPTSAPTPTPRAIEAPTPTPPPPKAEKSGKKWLWLLIAGAGAAAGIALAGGGDDSLPGAHPTKKGGAGKGPQ